MEIESEIFSGEGGVLNSSNDYEDVKLLNITANAKLYRATRQGKYFLLKTTKDNTEYQQRLLRREYELSIGSDHPHIVHIFIYEPHFAFGPAIVMEYFECRTLKEYIAENPSREERERLFDELLKAVEYLHKRGVIHNDLKPENILVTRADNRLKLIDFGLADCDAEAVLRQLGCTPRYASPELREQRGDVDARSDIYSVGVIMQEMLGDSAVARRCVRVNPEQRFANIEALRRAWKNRHRGWRILRNVALTLVVIAPMLLYLMSYVVAKQRDDARERMLMGMEQEINTICDLVADSLSRAPYVEFAAMHIQSMWEQSDAVHSRYMSMTDDVSFQAQLKTRYERLYKQNYEAYIKNITELPSLYMSVRGDELDYLDSLVRHRIPYSPYPKITVKDKKRQ